MWSEIFDDVLETGQSRLSLALVCKYWRNIILTNARLWRRISLRMKDNEEKNYTEAMLEARLNLTGSVKLEVLLDANSYPSDNWEGWNEEICFNALHRTLAQSGLQRWVSVTIPIPSRSKKSWRTEYEDLFIVDPNIFSVGLSQLRSLHIERIGSYVHLWPLIMQSSPSIQNLYLNPQWNETTFELSVLDSQILFSELDCRSLLTLKATSEAIANTPLPLNIQDLHLINSDGPIDITPLDGRKIRRLTVDGSVAENGIKRDVPILFPSLTTLTLHWGPSTGITQLDAPQLHTLVVGAPSIKSTKSSDEESENIAILFRELYHMVHISPTVFHMHYSLSMRAAYSIMEKWNQLEDLLLTIDEECSWWTRLGRDFQKTRTQAAGNNDGTSTWKLCPNLRTLRLKTVWDSQRSEEWGRIAGNVLEARKGGALQVILWTCNSETWEQVLRCDGY
jgi:hypothetical protein